MKTLKSRDMSFLKEPYQAQICYPTDANIDWKKIKWDKIDWDCVVKGYPYQIVRAEYYPDGLPENGFYKTGYPLCHCIGGRYGNNNYYVYPLFTQTNEQWEKNEYIPADPGPTRENLKRFNGEAPVWGVVCENTSYFRKGKEVNKGGRCKILRNGEVFYEISGGLEYGFHQVHRIIDKLMDHPCNFIFRNWKDELMNRKIWFNNCPAIITSIIQDQGCIIIEPDKRYIKYFPPSVWNVEDDGCSMYDRDDSVKVEYLSNSIWWWRNDKQTETYMKYKSEGQFVILEKAREMAKDGRMSEKDVLELEKVIFQRL